MMAAFGSKTDMDRRQTWVERRGKSVFDPQRTFMRHGGEAKLETK
jgi:hypothetical protein